MGHITSDSMGPWGALMGTQSVWPWQMTKIVNLGGHGRLCGYEEGSWESLGIKEKALGILSNWFLSTKKSLA